MSELNNLLSIANSHIIIDCLETWPNELNDIIKQNQDVLTSYLELEKDIDNRAEKEVKLRIDRPKNKYKEDWDDIINSLKEILKSKNFVGFHCTRLIDNEINKINKNGLKPLCPNFLKERLKYLYKQNEISKQAFQFLINNNLTSEKNRKGKVFFFHCLATLESDSGINNLFKYWGGEAIYRCYEDNHSIKNELLNIGMPCIVLGSLNYNQLYKFNNMLETRLIKVFLNNNNLHYNGVDFDNYVENNVSVIDIITYDNKLFDYLTGYRINC